eukprot:1154955-Pelagomonas_calceolata.AAC.4
MKSGAQDLVDRLRVVSSIFLLSATLGHCALFSCKEECFIQCNCGNWIQVVEFVYTGLHKGEPLHVIVRNLVAFCVESNKPGASTDNVTATLVLFKEIGL